MTDAPDTGLSPSAPATTARTRMHWWIIIPLTLLLLGVATLIVASWRRPPVGLIGNRLRPCPDTPNCVGSFESDPGQAIGPLEFLGSSDDAWTRLQAVLRDQPSAAIITVEAGYLHAEFTTPVFRFVDDIEFLLDREAGLIHVRSASRVGRSDLGANRQRVERIREEFSRSG